MKNIQTIFSILFCFCVITANAQTKSFELSNPHAMLLDSGALGILTSGYWRVYQDEVESRGQKMSTPKNTSMCYYPDGTFFYNGSAGTWKILDDRYITHQFDEKGAQERLNFGGVFSVTGLNDSTLTLTKLLTSSHDTKRTLHLKPSNTLTETEQPNSGGPYFYNGQLSQSTVDSLSRMDADELFDAGFTVLPNNTVHIIAPDSLYVIRLKAKK